MRRTLLCLLMDPLSLDHLQLSTSTLQLSNLIMAPTAQGKLRLPRNHPLNPVLLSAT